MARNLTNKQLKIVVDEIFEQVSQPIIEANNKALEAVKIDETKDEYLTDLKKYTDLKLEKKAIEEAMSKLSNKYYKNTYNGYSFGYYPEGSHQSYIKHLKTKLVKTEKYPTKNEIEKQVILAGNRDIPALIEQLVAKLK